jgi:Holliday junction resolvasome RuvABC endonuclease subunit
MNWFPLEGQRFLAVDPTCRGFGFAVLEGPERLLDWGVAHARKNKRDRCLARIAELIQRYEPTVIVAEDGTGKGSRRCPRVLRLLRDVRKLAAKNHIVMRSFPRSKVWRTFAEGEALTKHQIAKLIAARFPELAPRLPPFRKPWMSEDDRMSIFDALAFALTFFHVEEQRRKALQKQRPAAV